MLKKADKNAIRLQRHKRVRRKVSIIKMPTPYLLGSLAAGASRIARIVKPLLNFC